MPDDRHAAARIVAMRRPDFLHDRVERRLDDEIGKMGEGAAGHGAR